MNNTLKIAIACGGTGGHIFPGLATGWELKRRRHQVVLWLAGKDVEVTATRDWDGEIITIPSEGFPSLFSIKSFGTTCKMVKAIRRCIRIMKLDKPDVLLAMGSYASVGPVAAALRLGVPVVLHESNVAPGRAIRLFARQADVLAGHFEETSYYARKNNFILTGMPVRRELEEAASENTLSAKGADCFTLLIMGGSRGAHQLNDIASGAIINLHPVSRKLKVIHLAGVMDVEKLKKNYQAAGVDAMVEPFVHDMVSVYKQTHLAITRAGAATCAELSAFGIPALLVPYPYATNNHQMANARSLEKNGAADVIPESDLSISWLSDYLNQCIHNPERMQKMEAKARASSRKHGAKHLADVVETTARKRSPSEQNIVQS